MHLQDRVESSPEQMAACSALAEHVSSSTGLPTRVVGWYHSHPHITVLPSHVDVNTQVGVLQSLCKCMVVRYVCVYCLLHLKPACTACMYRLLHLKPACTACMYRLHVPLARMACMYRPHTACCVACLPTLNPLPYTLPCTRW